MIAEQNEKLRNKNLNANSRRIKQPQMKNVKPTRNEKLAIIKSKKPQMKAVKKFYPKCAPKKKNVFFFENKLEKRNLHG